MKLSSIAAAAALFLTGVSSHPDVAYGAPSHVYRRMDLKAPLVGRQDTGRCGAEGNGAICPGQSCCSMYGYCGTGPEYCNRFGCRQEFGWCDGQPPRPEPTTTSTTSAPEPTTPPAEEPTSPPAEETTTPTEPPTTGETSVPIPPELVISESGMCGNSTTCAGSGFGSCCSEFYWCGGSEEYCGEGCRSEFGECGDVEETPVPELTISTNGMCGNSTTCAGSDFGGCCSQFWYCGADEAYCGAGCKGAFGECDEA